MVGGSLAVNVGRPALQCQQKRVGELAAQGRILLQGCAVLAGAERAGVIHEGQQLRQARGSHVCGTRI